MSPTVNPARDEAFAEVQVELPTVMHPKPVLKMKVNTDVQGYIFPLWIYRKISPEHAYNNGFPTGTTPTQTKLTAYNGTPIEQYGICSMKLSYGVKETDARFYVADVNGPVTCGLLTSCELQGWRWWRWSGHSNDSILCTHRCRIPCCLMPRQIFFLFSFTPGQNELQAVVDESWDNKEA